MRRTLLLTVATLTMLLPEPASAGQVEAIIADSLLTVTGTAGGDTVTVRCEDGSVTVNHARPSGGPDDCRELRRILVLAGAGADRVGLADVTRSAFDELRTVVLRGEDGADTLIGSELGDELEGGRGTDVLRGGRGADHLIPGTGGGEAVGGDGRDLVTVSGDDDWSVEDGAVSRAGSSTRISLATVERVQVIAGPGDNRLSGSAFSGDLQLVGRRGADVLGSGSGDDVLIGGTGNDRLRSGAGDDVLRGGEHHDVLRAGAGNDELKGGSGPDDCIGGPGADSFVSC